MHKTTCSSEKDYTQDATSAQIDTWTPIYQALSERLPDSLKKLVARAIEYLGNSKESLCENWVGNLSIITAAAHAFITFGLMQDKVRYRAPDGAKKVAVFGVMNFKYVGLFYAVLSVHILGGTASVFGSALAVYFEERSPKISKRLAVVSAAAETFLHAPSAIAMSPFVYGDKGVSPFVYMATSVFLELSGIAAFIESLRDTPGPNDKHKHRRPELRRMSSTVAIFIYVRLYGLMRGGGGFLQPQKYTLAVMTAGTAMLPVGWKPFLFPSLYWGLMAFNWRTVVETVRLGKLYGVDKASRIMARSKSPLYR